MLDQQEKAKEAAVGIEQIAESLHHGGDLAPAAGPLGGETRQGFGITLETGAKQAPDQLVLAGIVAIECPIGEPHRPGDVADAGLRHALVDEKLERRRVDSPFGVLALAHTATL